MFNHIVMGVSTCLFSEPFISEQEYALLGRYPIAAVEIGYEHAGPALLEHALCERLVGLVRNAQPPVFSLHAPYKPDRDVSLLDEERRLAAVGSTIEGLGLASRVGARLVVIHGSQDPIGGNERAARRVQARKSLARIVAEAQRLNLKLALEMMPPEWLPASVDEAFEMVHGLDPDVIGFCLDTNHANLTGDLPEIVHALGVRLWHVHLSDNDGLKQRHWMPFRGVIDWKAFLEALYEVKYCGPLMYELDPHPAGLEQGLREITENFDRLQALVPGNIPM